MSQNFHLGGLSHRNANTKVIYLIKWMSKLKHASSKMMPLKINQMKQQMHSKEETNVGYTPNS